MKLDAAITAIMCLGQWAYMMRIDIKNAFHLFLVPLEDWHLLGIPWKAQFYFNKVLSLGLRSAFLFDCLDSAIECLLHHEFSIEDIISILTTTSAYVGPHCQ